MTRGDFAKALTALAHHCGHTLNDFDYELYGEGAAALGWVNAIEAIKRVYRKTSAGGRFPSVEQLFSTNPGGMSDEEAAEDLMARIRSAVVSCGYTLPERAHAMVGPVGWKVIEMNGGWQVFCSQPTFDQLESLLVHVRNQSRQIFRQVRDGELVLPPAPSKASLPQAESVALPEAPRLTEAEREERLARVKNLFKVFR